jgi:hypothetical protein
MPNTNNLPSIVYLNKRYNAWMMDAHKWAADKGWIEGKDYYEIISEVAYWTLFDSGKRSPEAPVYFVKDNLTGHK